MNYLPRISGASGVVCLLLGALAVSASGQTWTSRGVSATGVIPASANSDEGPSLGNTQSQWTPRFQTPHTNFNQSRDNNVQADDGNDDAPDPLSLQSNMRQRVMYAGGDYEPQWQRRARRPMPQRPGQARPVTYNGRPSQRLAQAGGPNGPGSMPSPFAEDEPVPQGKRMPIPDGEVQYQNQPQFDGAVEGPIVDGDGSGYGPGGNGSGYGPGGNGWTDDGCCDEFGEGAYDPTACERFFVCSPLGFLNEFSVNGGVQSFKAPVDNGRNSNFGAHVGLNLGDALWHWRGIGYQVGAQFIESNFYGDQSALAYDPNSRRQVFVTAGLFHRAFYNLGWQGGAVVDYLNDRYYYNATMYQMRAELSYLFYGGNELGAWITAHTRNSPFTFGGANQTLEPVDLYALFYRKTFVSGTQGRFWAGFTNPIFVGGGNNNASAMVGADFRMALSNRWDFTGVVNYLPSTQGGSSGQQAEAW
ncbi:MAG TPA: DUF6666 family protein, partial [Pirellulales bacterium]|nr:DUF6666 family protein [Pirellulales bacterium]